MTIWMSGARLREALVLAGVVVLLGCGPPPFLVHVTYPGDVDVERGSPVIYQGVTVGEVQSIALRQEQPSEPALIDVTLAISEPSVVLRENDRFHLASLRGRDVVEVEPWPEASRPLRPGSTVAGVPPLVTRVEQSVGEAIESIGAVVVEALETARLALEQERQRGRRESGGDSASEAHGSAVVETPP